MDISIDLDCGVGPEMFRRTVLAVGASDFSSDLNRARAAGRFASFSSQTSTLDEVSISCMTAMNSVVMALNASKQETVNVLQSASKQRCRRAKSIIYSRLLRNHTPDVGALRSLRILICRKIVWAASTHVDVAYSNRAS